MYKREWRILLEAGTRLGPSTTDYIEIPAITPESQPRTYTQLPEGLKGTRDGSWPYPFGEKGLKARLGPLARVVPKEELLTASNAVNAPKESQ